MFGQKRPLTRPGLLLSLCLRPTRVLTSGCGALWTDDQAPSSPCACVSVCVCVWVRGAVTLCLAML
ncbi:hypothetical protein HKD37_U058681 [Glycine soja]